MRANADALIYAEIFDTDEQQDQQACQNACEAHPWLQRGPIACITVDSAEDASSQKAGANRADAKQIASKNRGDAEGVMTVNRVLA